MLFAKSTNVIRTDVENLLLREMVEEDRAFLIAGYSNSSALDDMISENKVGLFDDNVSYDDNIEDILNDEEDDWIFDYD